MWSTPTSFLDEKWSDYRKQLQNEHRVQKWSVSIDDSDLLPRWDHFRSCSVQFFLKHFVFQMMLELTSVSLKIRWVPIQQEPYWWSQETNAALESTNHLRSFIFNENIFLSTSQLEFILLIKMCKNIGNAVNYELSSESLFDSTMLFRKFVQCVKIVINWKVKSQNHHFMFQKIKPLISVCKHYFWFNAYLEKKFFYKKKIDKDQKQILFNQTLLRWKAFLNLFWKICRWDALKKAFHLNLCFSFVHWSEFSFSFCEASLAVLSRTQSCENRDIY